MTISFEQMEEEAQQFAARVRTEARYPGRVYIVADFEYEYDRSRYDGYCVAEGPSSEPKLRWPFHRIAAACWTVITFAAGSDLPNIAEPVIMSNAASTESEMVTAFFEALSQVPDAVLVTWGGETKDLAVLRRCACEYSLALPPQVRELSPHSLRRLDICNAVAVRAESVHLPEYASACSIPTKPSPSKTIGKLVKSGNWPLVEEQCLADVVTTSIIALQHLASQGLIICDQPATIMALTDKARKAAPDSAFFRKVVIPWARDRLAASGLRGVVYRAA